ncbi:hypothetical protein M1D58_27430 (plasmid) [Pseudomonas sp. R4-76]|uniref:hypothetical protein n=1 Tax=unclassified Pseudomonas TaxID=196821 RepID=UPI003DA9D2A2
MKTAVSVIIQIAMFCLSALAIPAGILMYLRFLAFGDNHPFNAVLGFFGVGPVVLNIADMNWLSTSGLQIAVSILSAGMVYAYLAGFLAMIARDVGDWADSWANTPIFRRKKPGV